MVGHYLLDMEFKESTQSNISSKSMESILHMKIEFLKVNFLLNSFSLNLENSIFK